MARIWVPPEDDPMRAGQYAVVCGVETDRSLFVLLRNANPGPEHNGPAELFIHIAVEPPLRPRGYAGHGDRKEELYVALFDLPTGETDRLDVTVTLKSFQDPTMAEHYSTTRLTRQDPI